MQVTLDRRTAWAHTGGLPFDAARPCALLVHGALNDHSVWSLQARALAHRGLAVLAVDLPGHGRSAGPALPSIPACADWLLALLHALGASGHGALLAGHSMGSLIALEAASRLAAAGHAPAALVMVGTAYPMKVAPALLEAALAEPRNAIDRVNALSHSTLAAKPSNPGPGVWLHGASRALMRRLQAGYAEAGHGNLFHHDFGLCDRYAGAEAAAAAVRASGCRARLVLGARDAMTQPRAAAALAAALNAEVITLAAGHALMAEAPGGVLDALTGVLPLAP